MVEWWGLLWSDETFNVVLNVEVLVGLYDGDGVASEWLMYSWSEGGDESEVREVVVVE